MATPNPDDFNWLRTLGYASFAGFGGLMGHLLRALDKGEKIKPVRAAVEGLSSGFFGALVLFACTAFQLSEMWTGVIVGVFGWLGATASVRLLETIAYKKLNITTDELRATKELHDDKPAA